LLYVDAKMHAALGEFFAACDEAIALQKSNWHSHVRPLTRSQQRNHERKKMPMLPQDDTLSREIAAKNKRQADVLWKILIAMRLVIPAYVIYVIYLSWTMPPSAYLLTGH
jgi:nitrate/nitrite-specific signal transduction histidine kinase